MGKFYESLNDDLKRFISAQRIFFVATAPHKGRINISPKGMDTFRCIDNRTVAYLDLTGSGNETSAHLLENGRMTVMFTSFSETPLVVRLYGQGRVVREGDSEWNRLYTLFEPLPGTRQIVVLHIDSVQTSCGYGVPVYKFVKQRDTLKKWAEKKGAHGIKEYWKENNLTSIDGLPTHLMR